MSEIQVGQINSTDGSTAITTGADGYVSFAKTQIGGRRNLIINGAMQVAQRGTSETGVTTSGYTTVDRFSTTMSSIGTYTISQSTDAPDGFSNSFKIDCTTADASPASTDALIFRHRIEAQDCQHLKFGTSDAQSLTLSFWVKSNKTGNANVIFKQPDANRVIGGQYTISSANTWEHKTITVGGDTSGTINNDNGTGIQLDFWLDSGSNYTGGTLPTAWETNNNPDVNAGNTINIADNTANEWYITGVQLEVGPLATPFEHRSYGEELALCQRYYYLYVKGSQSTGGSSASVCTGAGILTNYMQGSISFPTTMRAAPTLVSTTGTGYYELYSGSSASFNDISGQQFNPNSCTLLKNGVTITSQAAAIVYTSNANASIALNAEL